MTTDARGMWVLLITDGEVIEYPPELYSSRSTADREVRRWVWLLSSQGASRVELPFPGRWTVGIHDVRLVEVTVAQEANEPWIGTFWSRDGYPDPEALVLEGKAEATRWLAEHRGRAPTELRQDEWLIAATYTSGDREEYGVAHLAKIVIDELPT